MQATKEAIYPHSRNLSRGLYVLRVLNESPGGDATARDISEQTKLNRSTVKRILETLVTDGYVRPCASGATYRLLPEVAALSKGLTSEIRLLDRASPILREIAQSTHWSLRIATARNDEMVIRDTTHSDSDMAGETTVGLGRAIPMLLTASGRAYFASCSETERNHVVDSLRSSPTEQSQLARNPRLIEMLVRRVRDEGYGTNDGDWGGGSAGAIALPIKSSSNKTIACMSMLYPRPGTGRTVIETECLPLLRTAVSRIEVALR